VLGVDSYERVNRVLNRYKEGESPDVKRLQYELCSILAASEEEQLIFDRTFEGFLGRYIFEVKAAEHDPALDISKKISRTRWGFRGFSLLLALLAIYGYFSFFYVKIIPEPIVAQLPGSYDMFLADTSRVRQLPPLFSDSIVSRRWGMDPNTAVEGKPYHLLKEGDEFHPQTQLTVFSGKNRQRSKLLDLRYQRPLEVSIWEEERGDEILFFAGHNQFRPDTLKWPSHLKQAYEQEANAYKLIDRSYNWVFRNANEIDSIEFEGSEFSLPMEGLNGDLQLQVTAFWEVNGDTISWDAQASYDWKETSGPQKSDEVPFVPISYKYLDGPDMDELRGLMRSNYLLPFILLLGLLLFLIYELFKWRQKKVIHNLNKGSGGPIRIDLEIEASGWPKFDDPMQEEALIALRARQMGPGETLDIPSTLEATITSGGIPDFHYLADGRAPHYLFLIEEKSKRDHLALYFAAWVKEMGNRDITAECYFYRRSPKKCWRDFSDRDSHRSLGQLQSIYSEYRLVIIGEGKSLFDLRSGKPGGVMQHIESWSKKALLSTLPYSAWEQSEKLAKEYLPVLPANSEGLYHLSLLWSDEDALPKLTVKTRMEPEVPVLPTAEADELETDWQAVLPDLWSYLGKRAMQWLAACSLHSEMEWELTLNLGRVLDYYFDEAAGLRLFRLPWFRQGVLPEELRAALLGELEPSREKEVLTYLASLLSLPENRAPENSLAEQEQRSQLAMLRFLRSDKGPQAKAALETVIRSLPPEEIQDKLILKQLGKIKRTPFRKLTKSWFDKQNSYFGYSRFTRMALFSVAAAVVVLCWLLVFGNPLEKRFNKRGLTESQLRADLNPTDSLLWFHYRAWQASDVGNHGAAMEHLWQIYIRDSLALQEIYHDFNQARFNYILSLRDQLVKAQHPSRGPSGESYVSPVSMWIDKTKQRDEENVYAVLTQDSRFPASFEVPLRPEDKADYHWLAVNTHVYDEELPDWNLLFSFLEPEKTYPVNANEPVFFLVDRDPKSAIRYLDSLLTINYFDSTSAPNALFEAGLPARQGLIALLTYMETAFEGEGLETIDAVRRALGLSVEERCKGTFVISGRVQTTLERDEKAIYTLRWGELEIQTKYDGSFSLELDTCANPLAETKLLLSRAGFRDTLLTLSRKYQFYNFSLTQMASSTNEVIIKDRKIGGRITLINSSLKGVGEASVSEPGIVEVLTDPKGYFELVWGDPEERRKSGSPVSLMVNKSGFEVVNEEALEAKMDQAKQVRIYMARVGYIDSLRQAYTKTLLDAIAVEYQEQLNSVRGNDKLSYSQTQQRIQDIDEVKENKDKEAVYLARELAETNLDMVDRKKGHAIVDLQKGDASAVLEMTQEFPVQQNPANQDYIQKRQEDYNAELARSYYTKAEFLLSENKYSDAMKAFDDAAKTGALDADHCLKFGAQMEKAGRLKYAEEIYQCGFKYTNPTINQYKALSDRLSAVYANPNYPSKGGPDYMDAIRTQKAFLKELEGYEKQNEEKYDSLYVSSAMLIAQYYQYIPDRQDESYRKILREAVKILAKNRNLRKMIKERDDLTRYLTRYENRKGKGN
jgi:hypothetical protein